MPCVFAFKSVDCWPGATNLCLSVMSSLLTMSKRFFFLPVREPVVLSRYTGSLLSLCAPATEKRNQVSDCAQYLLSACGKWMEKVEALSFNSSALTGRRTHEPLRAEWWFGGGHGLFCWRSIVGKVNLLTTSLSLWRDGSPCNFNLLVTWLCLDKHLWSQTPYTNKK